MEPQFLYKYQPQWLNEFELDEFKESSCIYQYGMHLLKENNLSLEENYVVYIPNTEWYNIFRIKPRFM